MNNRITASEASGGDPHRMTPIYDKIHTRLEQRKNGYGFSKSILVDSLSLEQINQLESDGYKLEKIMADEHLKGTEYTISWR